MQLAGAATADQLNVVPELVVEEAVSPVGAPGTDVQLVLPGNVVTLTAPLWPDVPAASVASTVKLYFVEAARPLTPNDVPEVVAITDPF